MNKEELDKLFDTHVNELRNETHWGGELNSRIYYFGHKTQREDELFTVVDWGHIKEFINHYYIPKEKSTK